MALDVGGDTPKVNPRRETKKDVDAASFALAFVSFLRDHELLQLGRAASMWVNLFRIAAWLSLLAAALASLVLVPYRFAPGIPHSLDHFVFFLVIGLAFAFGYPNRYMALITPLISFAAAVEMAQLLVSGRHARFSDLLLNGIGIAIGVGLAFIMMGPKVERAARTISEVKQPRRLLPGSLGQRAKD